MGPLGLFAAGLPPEAMQPFMLGMPGAGALAAPGAVQPPGGDAGVQMAAQMQQYAQQLQGQLALMKQQGLPGDAGGAAAGLNPLQALQMFSGGGGFPMGGMPAGSAAPAPNGAVASEPRAAAHAEPPAAPAAAVPAGGTVAVKAKPEPAATA